MIETFAMAGLMGVSVEKLLTGTRIDRDIRVAIVEKGIDFQEAFDDRLASKIAEIIAKMMPR